MIRYGYLPQLQPPAPFVHVTLRNPVTGSEQRGLPAQIDTAADRKLFPINIVQALELLQIGSILIEGAGGVRQAMPSYPVSFSIHDLPAVTVEVVASPGESWILLGRDILNSHRILLNGPELVLELG